MFELKRLSPEGLEKAHQRALHYRLLNQPLLAESICRDVLAADPGDQEAQITLILCLCDQFGTEGATPANDVLPLARALEAEYDRQYYEGLVHERRAAAHLAQGGPGTGHVAYDGFRRAMECYERAEAIRPAGNDDALLRWNTCARILNARPHVRPKTEDGAVQMLE